MDTVVAEQEDAAAAARMDFVERMGPDASAIVFAFLHDPADLARAAAVSRSWRTLVMVVHLSKIQCLRLFPETRAFTRVQQLTTSASSSNNGVNGEDAGSTAAALALEDDKMEQMVYKRLGHALLSKHSDQSCIASCIGASTTDDFPAESIQNTLELGEVVDGRPSYWSSGGQVDPWVPEFLVYKLCSDLCLIKEFRVQPFKAFFQPCNPIYSAEYVRIRFGCPKSPLQHEDLVSGENEGQVTALLDDNYIWTYTSPGYPMLQENVLQTFKLPRPVLCIGGVVKVEFRGRIQKQEMDNLYYICMSHVQVVGTPLTRELGAAPCENGLVLNYFPDHESSGDSRCRQNSWHDFEARIWRELLITGQVFGFNQELLSRLLGPSLPFPVKGNSHGESKEDNRPLP